MKKVFILFVVTALTLTACTKEFTTEQIEASIIQGEKERLPLILQNLAMVDTITIDSMHLTVIVEPMQGLLYTTWTSSFNSKSIIVPVDSICKDEAHKDYILWKSHWDDAARAYLLKSLGL